jgi:hypothetical protein
MQGISGLAANRVASQEELLHGVSNYVSVRPTALLLSLHTVTTTKKLLSQIICVFLYPHKGDILSSLHVLTVK